jgi:hypothetical protein
VSLRGPQPFTSPIKKIKLSQQALPNTSARDVMPSLFGATGNRCRVRPPTAALAATVGRDEEVIRAYIRNQELADQQLANKWDGDPIPRPVP